MSLTHRTHRPRFSIPVFSLLLCGSLVAAPAAPQTCQPTDVAITGSSPTDAAALTADCTALLSIKDALRGTGTLNWATDVAIGSWDGITLRASDRSRVTKLSRDGGNLNGTIPGGVSKLTELTRLDLRNNQLSERIPDLNALTKLTRLLLGNNDLSGPIPDLSALNSLITLALQHNDLSGPIPDLSALTNLRFLYLNDNELTGEIPDLSALTELRELRLSNNELIAEIPDLSALTKLAWLYLNDNGLTGEIPDLSALTNLRLLNFGSNRLTGTIDAASFPAGLSHLFLDRNELTGEIPDLSGLTRLAFLYLHDNRLTGSIPASLGSVTGLVRLHLARNGLTGSIPSQLGSLTDLEVLSLCETNLTASETLPTALETLRLSHLLAVWGCVRIEDATAAEGEPLNFKVTHSVWPARGGGGLRVVYRTQDVTAQRGADYAASPDRHSGSVMIPGIAPGASSASGTIEVATVADRIEENDETFRVIVETDTPNWARIVVPLPTVATGTIQNASGTLPGPSAPPPSEDEDDAPQPTPGPTPGPTPQPQPQPEPEPAPKPLSAASFDVEGANCDEDLCRALTDAELRFIDTSTGDVRSREWDFGDDGRQQRSATVRRTWSEPGFYTVTLRVSDDARELTASRTLLVEAAAPAGSCVADDETRCLQDSRFAVTASWWTAGGENGPGKVVREGTNESALFHFSFDRGDNWEMLVKVLDACGVNEHVWVYGASATDLGYRIRVTDTVTGRVRDYENGPGMAAAAITDGTAFSEPCGG